MYYRMNESIIDDATYDQWVGELIDLQQRYPIIAEEGVYADVFRGFERGGSFALPIEDPWVVRKAIQLLNYRNQGGD